MKYKINRKVNIGGVVHWIRADNEQQYAEKIIAITKSGSSCQTADTKQKHNFRDYALEWFNVYSVPNIATVTATTYDRQLTNYLFPAFGDMAVEDITTSHVQQLFNSINGAKATKDKIKIVLNQIFQSAIDDGIISKNPLKSSRLKIDGAKSKETPPYTIDEMKYLAARLDDIRQEQDRLYLALQMFHPLRLEEVLGLRWEDVDFNNQLLYIRRAATHPTRNQPEVKEPKTEQSKRIIGLSNVTSAYLSTATNSRTHNLCLDAKTLC